MMTYSTAFLGKETTVIIDRKLGSTHPKYPNLIYELNYGYIPDTKSGDGEELDAYVLGIKEPIGSFTGRCIAVIRRQDEEDDKLVIAPSGTEFTEEEIVGLTNFQEKYFNSRIIR